MAQQIVAIKEINITEHESGYNNPQTLSFRY